MAENAPTDTFQRPALAWYVLFETGLASGIAMAVSPTAYDKVAARVPVPPRRAVQAFVVGTAAVHVLEARAAYRMARAAGMDRSAARWARQTFFLGFPVLLQLRKVSR